MDNVSFASLADAIQDVMGTDPRSLNTTLDTTMARAALLLLSDEVGIPGDEVRDTIPSGEYYRLKSLFRQNEYIVNDVIPKVLAKLNLLENDPE